MGYTDSGLREVTLDDLYRLDLQLHQLLQSVCDIRTGLNELASRVMLTDSRSAHAYERVLAKLHELEQRLGSASGGDPGEC